MDLKSLVAECRNLVEASKKELRAARAGYRSEVDAFNKANPDMSPEERRAHRKAMSGKFFGGGTQIASYGGHGERSFDKHYNAYKRISQKILGLSNALPDEMTYYTKNVKKKMARLNKKLDLHGKQASKYRKYTMHW